MLCKYNVDKNTKKYFRFGSVNRIKVLNVKIFTKNACNLKRVWYTKATLKGILMSFYERIVLT